MMRLRDLESALSSIDVTFPSPNIALEQYPTNPHLASRILFTAQNSYDDITHKHILDLGCGTGILSLAACMLDADSVLAVDCDVHALEKAQQNANELELSIDFLLCKIPQLPFAMEKKIFDTVVMNPPFGTKSSPGIDWVFLDTALRCAPVVYSLHKTSTRNFLLEKAKREFPDLITAEVLAELRFDLPKVYKFHKKDNVCVQVDLLRFERKVHE